LASGATNPDGVTNVSHFSFPRAPVLEYLRAAASGRARVERARRQNDSQSGQRQERDVSYFTQQKGGRDKASNSGTVADTGANGGTTMPVAAPSSKDMISTFGRGTLITGNIVCDGAAEIFGRVIGDIQAAQVAIGDGARVEGNITAHEVAINGAFKGTIRAHSVKLKGAAAVDGEVFSKSLTVEENVQFEGLSRRLEKPIELASSAQAASATQPATPSSHVTPSIHTNSAKPLAVAASNSGPGPLSPLASPSAFSQSGV
jgi:cytoskeletal protein CcmA (bactofilin family)